MMYPSNRINYSQYDYDDKHYKELDFDITKIYFNKDIIDDEVRKIIYMMKGKTSSLLEIKKKEDVQFFISVVIEIWDKNTPSISLGKDMLSFANTLNVEYDFDMYVYDNL
ncbi:hypothetical protein M2093_000835 [Breznakia sp. PH1-1]|nr:hypothetical protein [Breznakia sp. PH1-1]MDH6403781.1 hypothetical protein [Breznakia sp. PF1-11]MDH6411490.1 hypothetical protein [Breznakia sp. PFB1-11]MDH6413779.1 hypothetical protein [Breznakia sp. PFB1-14]MDH6418447.1 hypothetical protein [Breznakia sp. PFB1-12]MDH6473561.1 hypothetical protein [Breznakia sp. PFB2-30]